MLGDNRRNRLGTSEECPRIRTPTKVAVEDQENFKIKEVGYIPSNIKLITILHKLLKSWIFINAISYLQDTCFTRPKLDHHRWIYSIFTCLLLPVFRKESKGDYEIVSVCPSARPFVRPSVQICRCATPWLSAHWGHVGMTMGVVITLET